MQGTDGPTVKWSPAEIAILIGGGVTGVNAALLAQLPGRTVGAVRKQASRHGIPAPSLWSPEETARLRKLYRTAHAHTFLSAFPGRTLTALVQRACVLGLARRRGGWTADEDAIITAHYPRGRVRAVQALLPHRGPDSIANRVEHLNLKQQRFGPDGERRWPVMHHNPWTAAEDLAIQTLYLSHGAAAVHAAVPQRKLSAIRGRAKELGLRCHHPWSAEEDALLREHYTRGSAAAALPHIKPKTVRNRAQTLGLMGEGAKPWTKREDAILSAHYPGRGTAGVCRELPERSLRAIRLRAHALKVRSKLPQKPWSIKENTILRARSREGIEILRKLLPLRRRAEIIRQCAKLEASLTKPPAWSEEDKERLRLTYARGGMAAVLAEFPGRSESSVKGILEDAIRGGLRAGKTRPATDWTVERVRDLRELYPRGGSALMRTKHPDLRVSAIILKANYIGLSAPRRP